MSGKNRKVTEVADGIYRLGTQHANWYIVVDDSGVTVVDTGLPRYWGQLCDLLSSIGRSLNDVAAVLLTHADPDHLGNAQRIAEESAAPVLIHEADWPAAKRQIRIAPPQVQIWRPAIVAFLTHGIRNGLTRWPGIESPRPILPGARLDVPGQPLAIHTPGHTAGSMCFVFDRKDTVFVGDALFNKDPYSNRAGSIVSDKAFSADHGSAISSLSLLDGLDQATVLFGHGEPSHHGIHTVVEEARSNLGSRNTDPR